MTGKLVSDADLGDALSVTLEGPTGLTSGGVAVTWSGGVNGAPLIGLPAALRFCALSCQTAATTP